MSNPIANVYRFRDKVAVSVGSGHTAYLTPEQARNTAFALLGCSEDIFKFERFAESQFTTVDIEE